MKPITSVLLVAGAVGMAAAASPSPVVGGNPCTWGPSYWCSSTAHAKECDFPVSDCKKYCDNPKEYPQIKDGDICSPPAPAPGGNPCTWGPSYWCASKANAKKCGVKTSECKTYCDNPKEYPQIKDGDVCSPPAPLPGSDKCTQGPSYFCASKKNAKACGVKTSKCKRYCKKPDEYPEVANGDICKPKKH